MDRQFKRILIINPYGIGDVLFTTPVIKALKDKFPDSYVGYLCNSRVVPLLKNNKLLDETIVFEKEQMAKILKISIIKFFKTVGGLISFIREKKFDLAIDYSLNFQFSMFTMLTGIKTRIGLDRKRRSRFLTKRISLEGFNDKHVVDYYLSVLELIDIKYSKSPLELSLSKKDLTVAEDIMKINNVNFDEDICMAICPAGGQSWGEQARIKHWSVDKFAELADKAIKRFGVKIIIFTGSNEASIGNRMDALMQEKAVNLSGKTNLVEFAALLSKCRVLIANDGGPIHVGAALGLSIVSIFGPVDEKVYGPYPDNDKHLVVKKNLPCRPCYKNFKLGQCFYNRRCLEEVTVEDVFDKVARSYSDIKTRR